MSDPAPRDRRPLFAALSSALVVLLFFGWFVTFGPGRWKGAEPSAMEALASQNTSSPLSVRPSAVTSALTPQVASPAPVTLVGESPAPLTEKDALTALAADALASKGAVTFQSQWAAQLASKYVGIVDPAQVTIEGSHKFLALDILAEHDELQAKITGARVLLLDSRTYGVGKTADGLPYWITVATDPSFTSADQILAWCAAQFPTLSGTALNNHCLPTQLAPLGG